MLQLREIHHPWSIEWNPDKLPFHVVEVEATDTWWRISVSVNDPLTFVTFADYLLPVVLLHLQNHHPPSSTFIGGNSCLFWLYHIMTWLRRCASFASPNCLSSTHSLTIFFQYFITYKIMTLHLHSLEDLFPLLPSSHHGWQGLSRLHLQST